MFLKYFQFIDNSLSYLFANHCNEKKLLNKFIGKKINYFDVGSNLGTETDFILKNFNVNEVHLFEPNIDCYSYLKKRYRNRKEVFVNNFGLGNNNEKKNFFAKKISSQSTFITSKDNDGILNESHNNYECLIKKLDTYFKNVNTNTIDYLKIDTEGYDLKVLLGAQNLLKNQLIRLIKIEISFSSIHDYFLKEIIVFLDNYDYQLISISKIKYNPDSTINFFDVFFVQKEYL